MIKHALRAIGYVWATPVTILGLLLSAVYWPRFARWTRGAIELGARRLIPRWAIAQTWGYCIYYSKQYSYPTLTWQEQARIRAHERAHVLQCQIFGVLFLVLYPLASLVAWGIRKHYYRDNVFEIWARRAEKKALKPGNPVPTVVGTVPVVRKITLK
jgi:hypothetical protein